jgi:predicted MFS family arabinose efflux permease
VTALHSTAAVFTRHRPMTTTTTTTPGQRALLLGWAAAFTLAKGLAWVVVLALVLARLDRLIPRKPATPASMKSMKSMESVALGGAIAGLDLDAAAYAELAAVADELGAAPVRYRLPYGRIRGTN